MYELYIQLDVQLEWDPDKRKANLKKHKIDFANAAQMFEGPMLQAPDLREDYGEERFAGIGRVNHRVVTIVFSEPEPDVIRVISMRKATKQERNRFEKAIAN